MSYWRLAFLSLVLSLALYGTVSAAVTLTEYVDLSSPYVWMLQPAMDRLAQEYGADLDIQVKHLPLTTIYPDSLQAAEASECARDQGKFSQYLKLALASHAKLDSNSLKAYAAKLGLDAATFNACLDSQAKLPLIRAQEAEAAAQGILAVPAVVIGTQKIVGYKEDYTFYKTAVDAVRANSGLQATSANSGRQDAVGSSNPAGRRIEQTQARQPAGSNNPADRQPSESPASQQNNEAGESGAGLASVCITDSDGKETCYDPDRAKIALGDNSFTIAGTPKSEVSIVIYADLQNPVVRALDGVMARLKGDYGSRISVEYRQFPMTEEYAQARKVAEASECARTQGKFDEYKAQVFNSLGQLQDYSLLKKHAADAGLDTSAFYQCMRTRASKAKVDADIAAGKAAGAVSNPTYFVNKQYSVGVWEYAAYKAALDEEFTGKHQNFLHFNPVAVPDAGIPTPVPPQGPQASQWMDFPVAQAQYYFTNGSDAYKIDRTDEFRATGPVGPFLHLKIAYPPGMGVIIEGNKTLIEVDFTYRRVAEIEKIDPVARIVYGKVPLAVVWELATVPFSTGDNAQNNAYGTTTVAVADHFRLSFDDAYPRPQLPGGIQYQETAPAPTPEPTIPPEPTPSATPIAPALPQSGPAGSSGSNPPASQPQAPAAQPVLASAPLPATAPVSARSLVLNLQSAQGRQKISVTKSETGVVIESGGVSAVAPTAFNAISFAGDGLHDKGSLVSILPGQALAAAKTALAGVEITSITLTAESGTPVYEVAGARKGSILGFIPVSVNSRARVSAASGQVEGGIQSDWWAFLVGG